MNDAERYKAVQVGMVWDVRDTERREYATYLSGATARLTATQLNDGTIRRVNLAWRPMEVQS